MSQHLKVASLATAAAALMAMTACSSSGGGNTPSADGATTGSATTTGGTSTSAAAASGAAIKVGIICSCSGAFGGSVTGQVNTYRALVNEINGSGGINGHKIDLTVKDDAANPGTSQSQYQSLVSEHVVAIADFSFVDQPWAASVAKSGIPVVGANIEDASFNSYADFYPEGQTQDSITKATVLSAQAANATKIGILYCAEAPTCQQSAADDKTYGQQLGTPVVYSTQVSGSSTNFTAQCVAAQQAHADAMVILAAPTTAATIATDCSRQGYKPAYVMEGAAVNFDTAKKTPGLQDKLVAAYNNLPYFVDAPGITAMNTAIDKYYPTLRGDASVWNQEALNGWGSGLLLQAAIKAGGLTASDTPSSAEIVKGLTSLKDETLGGMAPPLNFTAGQPHKIDCWFTAEVDNGTTKLLNNGKVTCTK